MQVSSTYIYEQNIRGKIAVHVLVSRSKLLAAIMAGGRQWTHEEWQAWFEQWEEWEHYQPVAKQEEEENAGGQDDAGLVEPPKKKAKLPVGPLHKAAADAGASMGHFAGFGQANPGGPSSGSSGSTGLPAGFPVPWSLLSMFFFGGRVGLRWMFVFCFSDVLALQDPATVGKPKSAPPAAGGTAGQQVTEQIPAAFHQAFVAAASAVPAGGPHVAGGCAGTPTVTTAEAVAGAVAGDAYTGVYAGVGVVPAKQSFAGYHWQDPAGNWHYWRQARFDFFFVTATCWFFFGTKNLANCCFFGPKTLQVQKGKTGFMNKLTMLVALHHLGYHDKVQRELQRLVGFSPLQAGLRELIAGHNAQGIDIFRELGYW